MQKPVVFLISAMLMVVSAAVSAASDSDTPADYANALPLQVSGKQGVVGFRLPQAVYRYAQTASLADLRVFDAKGVAQPFALYHPVLEQREQREDRGAAVFPVRAGSETGSGGFDLDIRTRADGSIESVRARNAGGETPGKKGLSALILDFGPEFEKEAQNGLRIEALRFSPPEGYDKRDNSYTAEVWLEISHDLKRWQAVGAAELGWLTNVDAQTLANDRLALPPQTFRYARITWKRGEPVEFRAIRAETLARAPQEPYRETLWLTPTAGKQSSDLLYAAGVAVPVERISLRLAEPNVVFPMTFGRYVQKPLRTGVKSGEWVFEARAATTFYQITQDGETRRSGALTVNTGHGADWVIRPLNSNSPVRPDLGISWQPATLVFLAGGTPPYSLRFGRGDAKPASVRLAQVAPGFTAKELEKIEPVQTGEMQLGVGKIGGSVTTDAEHAARQRTMLLWGVLLLGLAVLSGMVWVLVRQMKGRKPSGSGSDNP